MGHAEAPPRGTEQQGRLFTGFAMELHERPSHRRPSRPLSEAKSKHPSAPNNAQDPVTVKPEASDEGPGEPDAGIESDGLADGAFYELPKVRAQLLRMREIGVAAMLKARTKAEKQRVNKYYCEASLKRRVALLADPEVQNALEGVWQATDRDRSNHVNRAEYLVMHRKLVLALVPSVAPKFAFSSGRADWIRDSEGAGELNKDRFFRCWFELADLWSKQSPAIRSHVTAPPSQLCCL